MNCDHWIDQLYSDHSLTDNLEGEDSERLRSWSESQLAECESQVEATRLLDTIRLLNRYVREGGAFEDLFIALRANMLRAGMHFPSSVHPDELDPELEKLYPDESPPEE
jgi:hypothetical protein